MEWGELATHLGISRSMLDFVRKGQRNLSFPAIRRLEDAEREAGILASTPAPPPDPEPSESPQIKKRKISEKGDLKGQEKAELMAKLDMIEKALAEFRSMLQKQM